jgi:hypothetical protein
MPWTGNRFSPQKGGTKLIQSTAIICREFPASNEGNYAGISGMNRWSYLFCREKQAMSHLAGNWAISNREYMADFDKKGAALCSAFLFRNFCFTRRLSVSPELP